MAKYYDIDNPYENVQNWVLYIDNDAFKYIPVLDDTLIFNNIKIDMKCPGNLLGVINKKGNEENIKWMNNNPHWEKDFGHENS